MTIESFYETLTYIVDTDRRLRLQVSIEAISTSLASLVQTPAQPTQQLALATALEAFDTVTASLARELTPSAREAISEVGGTEFFDPQLTTAIRASIGLNAMTPSVARDFVQDISTRRASFLANVKQTRAGLDELGVSGREPEAGSANVSFVIPRELFENKLTTFAKELIFFARLVEHISEASTGTAEVVVLETLSSSTPTIGILASVDVISKIATAVKSFLEVWKKVDEFRETRGKLKELGLSGQALKEVDEQITTVVEEVVETTTTEILLPYSGDPGRKNELQNALRQDTRRLFGQIERGLVVQFRSEPVDDESESAEQVALQNIHQIGRNLVFPKVEAAPLLLASGEVIEGELTLLRSRVTAKKTTTKSTTSKPKEAQMSS